MTEYTFNQSPFVPGARICIEQYGQRREDFVLKVHKNGNFTLRSNPSQQYRPHAWRDFSDRSKVVWSASETSQSFSRKSVHVWDETIDAQIAEEKASRIHDRKAAALSQAFSARSGVSREMTAAVFQMFVQEALNQISSKVQP